MQIQNSLSQIKAKFFSKNETFVGNVSATVDKTREKDSYRAIQAFYRDLPEYSGLMPNKVLLVIDGIRKSIYDPTQQKITENSYFNKMRKAFIKQGESLGYTLIDMHDFFNQHYQAHGQKFEFPRDWHWNELGHQVVSQAIQSTPWWAEIQKSL